MSHGSFLQCLGSCNIAGNPPGMWSPHYETVKPLEFRFRIRSTELEHMLISEWHAVSVPISILLYMWSIIFLKRLSAKIVAHHKYM